MTEIYNNLNSITNAQVNASAAIATSKLEISTGTATPTILNNNIAYQAKNSTATAKDLLKLNTNNILLLSQLRRQVGAAATNATVENQTIAFGYSVIGGDGSSGLSEAITFPTAFDDNNVIVTASFAGSGTWGSTAGGTQFYHSINGSSSTGFTINLGRTSGTFGIGTDYFYTWIAIGTKA